MKEINEFETAFDYMLYLRQEENYNIGWDNEKMEPVSSSIGEKWRTRVTDSEGTLKEEKLKGEWSEFSESNMMIYHEFYKGNSIYALIYNDPDEKSRKAPIAVLYK